MLFLMLLCDHRFNYLCSSISSSYIIPVTGQKFDFFQFKIQNSSIVNEL